DAIIQNPGLTPEVFGNKLSVLDIRAIEPSGRQFNVEMQLAPAGSLDKRFLFYWSKLHASQLMAGSSYEKLLPTISIVFEGFTELDLPRFHTVLQVLDVEGHVRRCSDFEMHLLQLPRVASLISSSWEALTASSLAALTALERWGLFFVVDDAKKREVIGMSDAGVKEANRVFEQMSQDPDLRQLALDRELAWATWVIDQQDALERGEKVGVEKGKKEGKKLGLEEGKKLGLEEGELLGRKLGLDEGKKLGLDEGEKLGLRAAIDALCAVLGIEIDATRRQALDAMHSAELLSLISALRTQRRWV
ncbi:MAG: Rpn family recombination-promoting nuclease/putative transposase, partial [Deltaproteobacteria bacterium]|nr:Rpn family recombination-promoting nuclease/putative transposase [Deltaproteobacteria bacterium]